MTLQHLTLGERIVMAARLMSAEHLRQEADEAGINVRRLQREMVIVRMNEAKAGRSEWSIAEPSFRQDLYIQPARGNDDDRRAA